MGNDRGRCFLYSRVSRPKKDAEVESLDVHKRIVKRYWRYRLKPKGIRVAGWYCDSGVSGDIRLRNRPEGKKMWERLRNGDHVVFAKLDRAFRNTADFHASMSVLVRRGVLLHFVDVNVDTSTYVGELLLGVLALIAQFERRRVSERMKDAHERRKALGKKRGFWCDYGFKWVGPKGNQKMVVDEYEMKMLAAIHELRCAGATFARIHAELKAKGFTYTSAKHKGVEKPWSQNRIQRAHAAYLKYIESGRVQHPGSTTPSSTTAADSEEPSDATPSPSTESTTSSTCPSPDPEPC